MIKWFYNNKKELNEYFEVASPTEKEALISYIPSSIVVQSHLSDVMCGCEDKNNRLNFCKYLINKLDGDLSKLISPDVEYKHYLNYYN